MTPHSEAAAPTGSIVGNGGVGNPKSVTLPDYRNLPEIATDTYPAIAISSRFGLTLALAAEVCRMAGIGGRAAS